MSRSPKTLEELEEKRKKVSSVTKLSVKVGSVQVVIRCIHDERKGVEFLDFLSLKNRWFCTKVEEY